jgi:hypothetical protein
VQHHVATFSLALQGNSAQVVLHSTNSLWHRKLMQQHNIFEQMYNNNIIFFATACTSLTAFTYATAHTRTTAFTPSTACTPVTP